MMARGQIRRQSTLIDPASLQRPLSRDLTALTPHGTRPPLGRRHSTGPKPLLSFDESAAQGGTHLSASPGMLQTRSVFGVDTLWEREMARLKEMEAEEAQERLRAEQVEAAAAGKRDKKKGKKGKEKAKPQDESLPPPALDADRPRVSAEPPVLPTIPKGITRGPPPPVDGDDTESESDDSDAAPAAKRPSGEGWFAGSSDDEKGKSGPVRTVGVGPRYPNRGRGQAQGASSDSEEDLPLAATVDRAIQRATRLVSSAPVADESDEEEPLSTLLEKTKLNLPPVDFDNILSPLGSGSAKGKQPAARATAADDEDEDEQPLGLRASRIAPMAPRTGADEDEDDVPLGLRPEQQRRTQYHMMLQQQQQQQQQQMMLQQMHTGMMFSNPSLMGSGFFGPPMVQPMMMPVMPAPLVPSPPPLQDNVKFGRVDKWRHDVAVEGQP